MLGADVGDAPALIDLPSTKTTATLDRDAGTWMLCPAMVVTEGAGAVVGSAGYESVF